MEGKWEVFEGSSKFHPTFLKGKRHCTLEVDCFGVVIDTHGNVYSINYPIQLKEGENWLIHKKDNITGDIIDSEVYL